MKVVTAVVEGAAVGRGRGRGEVARRGQEVLVAALLEAVKGVGRRKEGVMEWGRCGGGGGTSRHRAP